MQGLSKLSIVGGSGFLGKDLLKYGLNHYNSVTSISRNKPQWDAWWMNKVHFTLMPIQDLFTTINNSVDAAEESASSVMDADTVIYSVGTLFASSLYKKVLNNNDISQLPKWIRQEVQFQSSGAPLYDTLHYQYPIH